MFISGGSKGGPRDPAPLKCTIYIKNSIFTSKNPRYRMPPNGFSGFATAFIDLRFRHPVLDIYLSYISREMSQLCIVNSRKSILYTTLTYWFFKEPVSEGGGGIGRVGAGTEIPTQYLQALWSLT